MFSRLINPANDVSTEERIIQETSQYTNHSTLTRSEAFKMPTFAIISYGLLYIGMIGVKHVI